MLFYGRSMGWPGYLMTLHNKMSIGKLPLNAKPPPYKQMLGMKITSRLGLASKMLWLSELLLKLPVRSAAWLSFEAGSIRDRPRTHQQCISQQAVAELFICSGLTWICGSPRQANHRIAWNEFLLNISYTYIKIKVEYYSGERSKGRSKVLSQFVCSITKLKALQLTESTFFRRYFMTYHLLTLSSIKVASGKSQRMYSWHCMCIIGPSSWSG